MLLCALSVLPAKAYEGVEYVGNTAFYYNNVDGGVEITNNSNAIINLCADIKAKAERYADEIPVSQKNNIKQLLSYV